MFLVVDQLHVSRTSAAGLQMAIATGRVYGSQLLSHSSMEDGSVAHDHNWV